MINSIDISWALFSSTEKALWECSGKTEIPGTHCQWKGGSCDGWGSPRLCWRLVNDPGQTSNRETKAQHLLDLLLYNKEYITASLDQNSLNSANLGQYQQRLENKLNYIITSKQISLASAQWMFFIDTHEDGSKKNPIELEVHQGETLRFMSMIAMFPFSVWKSWNCQL